jgi:hypothetical protein
MDGNLDPLDSLVKEILGNIRFLDSCLTKTGVYLGIVGIFRSVGLLVVIALFLK